MIGRLLILFYLSFNLTQEGFGQDTLPKSTIISIKGTTFIEESKDTMPLVVIEVFSGGEKIAHWFSDYDGSYRNILCNCKIVNDSILIRLTGYHCEITELAYHINSDTLLNLPLKIDPEEKIGFKELDELNSPLTRYCGNFLLDYYRKKNPLMRNCDGRELHYSEIKENLFCWELVSGGL